LPGWIARRNPLALAFPNGRVFYFSRGSCVSSCLLLTSRILDHRGAGVSPFSSPLYPFGDGPFESFFRPFTCLDNDAVIFLFLPPFHKPFSPWRLSYAILGLFLSPPGALPFLRSSASLTATRHSLSLFSASFFCFRRSVSLFGFRRRTGSFSHAPLVTPGAQLMQKFVFRSTPGVLTCCGSIAFSLHPVLSFCEDFYAPFLSLVFAFH